MAEEFAIADGIAQLGETVYTSTRQQVTIIGPARNGVPAYWVFVKGQIGGTEGSWNCLRKDLYLKSGNARERHLKDLSKERRRLHRELASASRTVDAIRAEKRAVRKETANG